MIPRARVGMLALICLGVVLEPGSALGQGAPRIIRGPQEIKRDNYNRLQKRLTIELTEQRLEDVVMFIRDLTGAEIDAIWSDDRSEGLEKDKKLTLAVKDQPALRLLEKILERVTDSSDGATWQFTSDGQVEIGTKASLNRHAELKLYPIHDMLVEIPEFTQVPQLDLNSVLSQGGSAGGGGGGGGGGGSSSLFNDAGGGGAGGQQITPRDEENAKKIMDLITETIDPPQWQDNGGDGASIRFHNGNLLIKAPDYIHRQIIGYAFMR